MTGAEGRGWPLILTVASEKVLLRTRTSEKTLKDKKNFNMVLNSSTSDKFRGKKIASPI